MSETTYWSSSTLTVTSAKIAYQDTVLPISAIATVRVEPVPEPPVTAQMELDKGDFYGMIGVALVMASFALVFVATIKGSPGLVGAGILLALAGMTITRVGLKAKSGRRQRRIVAIAVSSGEYVRIPVASQDVAEDLQRAIAKAMTRREMTPQGQWSLSAELSRLHDLRRTGVITDADWDRAKGLFLGKDPDARETSLSRLRRLHELHKDGVLSEAEFNMKKWDVLSTG